MTKGVFAVPAKCFKTDQDVQTTEDLMYLLRSLQYWQVFDIPNETLHFIYAYGHFNMGKEFPELLSTLQKLKSVKEAIPKRRIPTALKAKLGVDMVTWLHARTSCELSAEACAAAAGADDLESLTYLHENGCPWDSNTIKEAIKGGSIACLKYAQDHGCPGLQANDKTAINFAAEHGQLAMIAYLRNRGEEWDTSTSHAAAMSGSVACLKYLHEAGCTWNAYVCHTAAMEGNLACLQFAHERGCPWDENTTLAAVLHGHVDCLQYAHEHGCLFHASITDVAAFRGHFDCLQYAHEHGCPWHKNAALSACRRYHWRCLYYALTHGAYCVEALVFVLYFLWFFLFSIFRGEYLAAFMYLGLLAVGCYVTGLVSRWWSKA